MADDTALRQHVLDLLDGENAHLNAGTVMGDWPAALRGRKPGGAPHTAWQLLEHLRLAQADILDFCRNPQYMERTFPDDYWPRTEAPSDGDAWARSLAGFLADLDAVKVMVSDPGTDLFARIPHGSGQTFLREALLVADHNAYHLGQLVLLRRVLGAWHDAVFGP